MANEIIPKDEAQGLISYRINKLKESIFDAQLGERFLQRQNIKNPSPTTQKKLGGVQAMIKSDKEYLEFLEEILKEY